jgi:hypothetical protein
MKFTSFRMEDAEKKSADMQTRPGKLFKKEETTK